MPTPKVFLFVISVVMERSEGAKYAPTQWQQADKFAAIWERFSVPVLMSLTDSFTLVPKGFDADNGSEHVNR